MSRQAAVSSYAGGRESLKWPEEELPPAVTGHCRIAYEICHTANSVTLATGSWRVAANSLVGTE